MLDFAKFSYFSLHLLISMYTAQAHYFLDLVVIVALTAFFNFSTNFIGFSAQAGAGLRIELIIIHLKLLLPRSDLILFTLDAPDIFRI